MPKCKIIALTTPLPGKEAEFHDWYQNTHLAEMVSFPGSLGAERYELVAKMMGADDNQYLAIYDIEVDDPMTYLQAVGEAAASGKMTQSAASDMATTYTALFKEIGERVEPK